VLTLICCLALHQHCRGAGYDTSLASGWRGQQDRRSKPRRGGTTRSCLCRQRRHDSRNKQQHVCIFEPEIKVADNLMFRLNDDNDDGCFVFERWQSLSRRQYSTCPTAFYRSSSRCSQQYVNRTHIPVCPAQAACVHFAAAFA
jgi:hypothetical protein